MAIPDYQSVMLPLLQIVKQHGQISLANAAILIAVNGQLK